MKRGFFFVEAVISAGYVRILTGRWWKLAYKQIHGNIRTMHEVQSFREGFLLFLFYSILKFRYSDIPLTINQKVTYRSSLLACVAQRSKNL